MYHKFWGCKMEVATILLPLCYMFCVGRAVVQHASVPDGLLRDTEDVNGRGGAVHLREVRGGGE